MKKKGLLIVAALLAVLGGGLIGCASDPPPAEDSPASDYPDPTAGLNLDPDPNTGCVTVSVDSDRTFLVVEVVDGRTGPITFVTKETGEKRFCAPGGAAGASASGMATAFAAENGANAEIKVFSVEGVAGCKDGFCVDTFEDYPTPWPPAS